MDIRSVLGLSSVRFSLVEWETEVSRNEDFNEKVAMTLLEIRSFFKRKTKKIQRKLKLIVYLQKHREFLLQNKISTGYGIGAS